MFELQKWFGALISQPLQSDHRLPSKTPFGTDAAEEVAKFIAPSPTLYPFERLEIYHQQYWWRLIKALHTNFPMLLRLFGYQDFQEKIAVPYLSACPPKEWTLCELGNTLPDWLQNTYHEEDRYLVVNSANIDWAAQRAFWIGQLPFVDFAKLTPDQQRNKKLDLQPFIHLFHLKADFFALREGLLKNEPDYYNTNHFPQVSYVEGYFVLYRTHTNVVTWKRIAQAEYWMLSRFQRGSTIEEACAELEQIGGDILEEALSLIPIWFKQWTVLKWFGSLSSSS